MEVLVIVYLNTSVYIWNDGNRFVLVAASLLLANPLCFLAAVAQKDLHLAGLANASPLEHARPAEEGGLAGRTGPCMAGIDPLKPDHRAARVMVLTLTP